LAFVIIFVATLMVSAIAAWLLSKLIKRVGLGALDRLLGALFGALRGMLIVLVLILLAGLTQIPKQSWWQDALLRKPLESMAQTSLILLPDNVAQRVNKGMNSERN
ncbi:MAG: CvpA family protein, partial [Gallionellaceae bacterium]|nr:CvpA family protein [Gallionellaceae bacterium]